MTNDVKTLTPAQELRKELKRLGYNARRVTVKHEHYSMGSSMYVTIRDPEVEKTTIEEIANSYERIDRCEYSGEILTGGNRFLTVCYSEEAKQARCNPVLPSINIAIDRLKGQDPKDDRSHVEFLSNFSMCRDGFNRVLIYKWDDDRAEHIGFGNIDYPETIADVIVSN